MINLKDQEQLFTLIAQNLTKDISCYAFGGNAMMVYGFKEETKDVDLLFEKQEERQEFSRIIYLLGYRETTPAGIYLPQKLRDPHAPVMYKREDSRFDLFVGKIFKTLLSPKMKEDLYAIHEFKGKHVLQVKVFRTEHLVMLKAVTDRVNDFDDIKLIIKKDTHFDWQYLIDEVLWQYKHGDSWIILDTEKMLQELKKYIFVEEKYIQQLHKAVKEKKKDLKRSDNTFKYSKKIQEP